MQTKEYLMRYEELTNLINELNEQLSELRSQFESVQGISFNEHIRSGDKSSMTEKMYERIETMQSRIYGAIVKRCELMFDIVEITSKMGKPLGTLLLYRYIKLMSWDEICTALNYDYSYICGTLHRKALTKFQEEQNKRIK